MREFACEAVDLVLELDGGDVGAVCACEVARRTTEARAEVEHATRRAQRTQPHTRLHRRHAVVVVLRCGETAGKQRAWGEHRKCGVG